MAHFNCHHLSSEQWCHIKKKYVIHSVCNSSNYLVFPREIVCITLFLYINQRKRLKVGGSYCGRRETRRTKNTQTYTQKCEQKNSLEAKMLKSYNIHASWMGGVSFWTKFIQFVKEYGILSGEKCFSSIGIILFIFHVCSPSNCLCFLISVRIFLQTFNFSKFT